MIEICCLCSQNSSLWPKPHSWMLELEIWETHLWKHVTTLSVSISEKIPNFQTIYLLPLWRCWKISVWNINPISHQWLHVWQLYAGAWSAAAACFSAIILIFLTTTFQIDFNLFHLYTIQPSSQHQHGNTNIMFTGLDILDVGDGKTCLNSI